MALGNRLGVREAQCAYFTELHNEDSRNILTYWYLPSGHYEQSLHLVYYLLFSWRVEFRKKIILKDIMNGIVLLWTSISPAKLGFPSSMYNSNMYLELPWKRVILIHKMLCMYQLLAYMTY